MIRQCHNGHIHSGIASQLIIISITNNNFTFFKLFEFFWISLTSIGTSRYERRLSKNDTSLGKSHCPLFLLELFGSFASSVCLPIKLALDIYKAEAKHELNIYSHSLYKFSEMISLSFAVYCYALKLFWLEKSKRA